MSRKAAGRGPPIGSHDDAKPGPISRFRTVRLGRAVESGARSGTNTRRLDGRSIVLVGMMGAGKSTVGRRLAARLGLPFVDADTEIEAAAGCSIPEIFSRNTAKPISVTASGGSSRGSSGRGRACWRPAAAPSINEDTRAKIADTGISVWLKADFDVLVRPRAPAQRPAAAQTGPDPARRR